MTRFALPLLAAAATLVAAPATAQMNHANMPGMTMPMPAKKPVVKKPAVKKAVAKKSVAKKPVVKRATVKKAPVTKPAAADPNAGHDMSAMPDMPDSTAGTHSAHDMSTMTPAAPAGTDLPVGNAPPPPVPTDRAADVVYGSEAMATGRHHLMAFHGNQRFTKVMFNIAEAQIRNGRDGFEWDGEGWYGGDIDRLWVKSEGDGAFGRSVDRAEVQALYSRAVGPYFNLQGGIRYDFMPNPSRAYAVIAVEGIAPSFFDIEGSLFLSNKGEVMARADAYYDQRITQRLILQPRAEINLAAQSSRAIGVGASLSDVEVGLRLRYDIRREFAPYVGVQYKRAFGDTRRYLREAGEDPGGWSLLTGVRFWF